MDSRAPLVDLEDGEPTAKVVTHHRPYKEILMDKRPIAPMQEETKIEEALKRCPAIAEEEEGHDEPAAAPTPLKSKAVSAPAATIAGSAKEQPSSSIAEQRPPLERRVAVDYHTREQATRLTLPESPVEEEIAFAAQCRIHEEPRSTKEEDEDLTSRLMIAAQHSTKHSPREQCLFPEAHLSSPQSDPVRPTHNVSEQPAVAETKSAESGAETNLLNELSPGDMQVISSMVVPTTLIVAAYETPGKPRPLPLDMEESEIIEEVESKAKSPPPRARTPSPTSRRESPFAHPASDRPMDPHAHELIGRDGHVHFIEQRFVPLVRRRSPSMEESNDQVARSNGGLRGIISRAANRVRDILWTGSFSGVRTPSPKIAEDEREASEAPAQSDTASPPQINHHETQKLLLSGAALP